MRALVSKRLAPLNLFTKLPLAFIRPFKMQSQNLKKGMIVEFRNELWEVEEAKHGTTAQRRANVQCTMRSLATGRKVPHRLRSGETVEYIELDSRNFFFSRLEGKDNIYFLDDYGDEIQIDSKLIDFNLLPWIQNGENPLSVRIRDDTGEPVSVSFPREVKEVVDEILESKDTIHTTVPARLSNGKVVKVPKIVEKNDYVRIKLPEEVYLSKD